MGRWIFLAGAGGAALLGARVAGARRQRLLHPLGRSFTGEVQIWGMPGDAAGVDLLDRPARYPATVRVSKGAPTPTGWPDVLGLAIRVHPPDGEPFDLLLSTTGPLPVVRHLPLPRRTFAAFYGSLLSYRTGAGGAGSRLYLAALPDPTSTPLGATLDRVAAAAVDDGARFLLAAAGVRGAWRPFGRLTFGAPLPAPVDAALAFDPTRHQTPGLSPAGLIQALRGLTYRSSQAWRGADPEPAGPSALETATALR